jgi:hypothetical protein
LSYAKFFTTTTFNTLPTFTHFEHSPYCSHSLPSLSKFCEDLKTMSTNRLRWGRALASCFCQMTKQHNLHLQRLNVATFGFLQQMCAWLKIGQGENSLIERSKGIVPLN